MLKCSQVVTQYTPNHYIINQCICNDQYLLPKFSFGSREAMSTPEPKREFRDEKLMAVIHTASSLTTFKATFTRTVNLLRWLGTTGVRFLLQWWFTKRPMFWLPIGWVPGYVEWVLAFPRAPTGSVSIQIWGIACNTVVQLIGAGVAAGWLLVAEQRERGRKEKTKVGIQTKAEQEKKEL